MTAIVFKFTGKTGVVKLSTIVRYPVWASGRHKDLLHRELAVLVDEWLVELGAIEGWVELTGVGSPAMYAYISWSRAELWQSFSEYCPNPIDEIGKAVGGGVIRGVLDGELVSSETKFSTCHEPFANNGASCNKVNEL